MQSNEPDMDSRVTEQTSPKIGRSVKGAWLTQGSQSSDPSVKSLAIADAILAHDDGEDLRRAFFERPQKELVHPGFIQSTLSEHESLSPDPEQESVSAAAERIRSISTVWIILQVALGSVYAVAGSTLQSVPLDFLVISLSIVLAIVVRTQLWKLLH